MRNGGIMCYSPGIFGFTITFTLRSTLDQSLPSHVFHTSDRPSRYTSNDLRLVY